MSKKKKEMEEQNVLQATMTQAENKKNRKIPYDPPVFKVIGIKTEGSFCTSVTLNEPSSTEEEWEEEKLDMGTFEVGLG